MMLTAKMNQTEPSLGVFSPVSEEKTSSDSMGFSSLFSSMVAEQIEGGRKFDPLLPSNASMVDEAMASLPLAESGVEQVVAQLPLPNQAALGLESVHSLEGQAFSRLEPERLNINRTVASDVSASLLINDASVDVSPSLKASEFVQDGEGLMVTESQNKISPPPVSLLESEVEYEGGFEGQEDDLLAFNSNVPVENQPLDLAEPNTKIGTSNQADTLEQVLLREDAPVLQAQEITSTVQAGLMASNTPNQGVVQGAGSTLNVHTANNQNAVSWGAQSTDGQASQGGGQQGQSFGQSSQNSSGQPSHQQAMMFAQMSQGDKQQALEQQAAVRAVNETLVKTEGRELLGGAEIASLDRKGGLPPALQAINLPLKHPQWGQALGQRIVFMSNNSLQQAQITLNPQNLGQIQVTLQLDKEQKMHISLVAQNGMTRESMESALPRLREMMEQAGVQLASVDIREQKQSFSENESRHAQNDKNGTKHSLAEEGFVEESTLATVGSTDNIVDYYA